MSALVTPATTVVVKTHPASTAAQATHCPGPCAERPLLSQVEHRQEHISRVSRRHEVCGTVSAGACWWIETEVAGCGGNTGQDPSESAERPIPVSHSDILQPAPKLRRQTQSRAPIPLFHEKDSAGFLVMSDTSIVGRQLLVAPC